MTERRPVGTPDPRAAERWEAARAWYTAASEAEIETMLEVEWAEWSARTPDDWMRIAVVALDQAGVHVADVRVSR